MDAEWHFFRNKFMKIFRVVFFSLLFVLPLGFLAWNAAQWNFVQEEEKEEPIVLEDGKVPEETVPQSFSDRRDAPALALLPSRSEQKSNGAPVPSATRKQIISRAEIFIKRWDSYRPALGKSRRYENKLRPLIASGASDIIGRNDVSTLKDLCPEGRCSRGSRVIGDPDLRIVDFSGTEAYLTGYGLIRIEGPTNDDLSGLFYTQSYALLMALTSSGWLVTRAAAETQSS
jgi:hypothetical protein